MNKILIYILILIIAILAISFVATYPTFHSQMKAADERIKNESMLLETKFGNMEYAVRGHFFYLKI